MHNERGGAKMDAVVKLVLVFFVSLLSFSIGTFVGKQVSDSDYRRASLEQDYKGTREVASDESEKEGGDNKALSEEDIKNLTDEFVQSEKGKSETSEPAGDKKQEGDTKADQDGYKKVGSGKAASGAVAVAAVAAEKVAQGQVPTNNEPEARKPNSAMPMHVAGSAIGKFTVQVASYADEEGAKNFAAGLKEKGWNAFYIPAEVKGHTWYRVSVGLFENSKNAMTFRERFMKEANTTNAVVTKIVQ